MANTLNVAANDQQGNGLSRLEDPDWVQGTQCSMSDLRTYIIAQKVVVLCSTIGSGNHMSYSIGNTLPGWSSPRRIDDWFNPRHLSLHEV